MSQWFSCILWCNCYLNEPLIVRFQIELTVGHGEALPRPRLRVTDSVLAWVHHKIALPLHKYLWKFSGSLFVWRTYPTRKTQSVFDPRLTERVQPLLASTPIPGQWLDQADKRDEVGGKQIGLEHASVDSGRCYLAYTRAQILKHYTRSFRIIWMKFTMLLTLLTLRTTGKLFYPDPPFMWYLGRKETPVLTSSFHGWCYTISETFWNYLDLLKNIRNWVKTCVWFIKLLNSTPTRWL